MSIKSKGLSLFPVFIIKVLLFFSMLTGLSIISKLSEKRINNAPNKNSKLCLILFFSAAFFMKSIQKNARKLNFYLK